MKLRETQWYIAERSPRGVRITAKERGAKPKSRVVPHDVWEVLEGMSLERVVSLDKEIGAAALTQLAVGTYEHDLVGLGITCPQFSEDGGHETRGLEIAMVPSPIWAGHDSLRSTRWRIVGGVGGQDENGGIAIFRWQVSPWARSSSDLEKEKPGVESRSFDQLVAAVFESIRLGDVDSGEPRAHPIEMGLEKKSPTVQHLDPLVQSIAEEKTPILRIDPSLVERKDTSVETAKWFQLATTLLGLRAILRRKSRWRGRRFPRREAG